MTAVLCLLMTKYVLKLEGIFSCCDYKKCSQHMSGFRALIVLKVSHCLHKHVR